MHPETARIKTWREAKRGLCPGGCGSEIAYQTILCRACTGRKRTEAAEKQTVAEIKATKNSLRWTDHVRALARTRWTRDDKTCEACGYSLYIEVCHRKSIASFPDDATVAEINRQENIVFLCKNHHWEMDHGFLQIPVRRTR